MMENGLKDLKSEDEDSDYQDNEEEVSKGVEHAEIQEQINLDISVNSK